MRGASASPVSPPSSPEAPPGGVGGDSSKAGGAASKDEVRRILDEATARHLARNARAVASAVAVAKAHGLTVKEPKVLAEACAVRVLLSPAPVVARVSTVTAVLRAPIEPWLQRELDVSAFLAAQGAPVVPPSDELPATPFEHDGLHMSFWRYVQPAGDKPPETVVAAQMLGELHAALRDYPGELPELVPLGDIQRGLDRLAGETTLVSVEDLAFMQRMADRILGELRAVGLGPVQPIHGDAHVGNLIPVTGGWLWNDFEDTCLGPVGWDLCGLEAGDEMVAHAAYPGAPAPSRVTLFRNLRLLQGTLWAASCGRELPAWFEYVPMLLGQLRALE
ncbi:aminoglycoside phosphotransferase family protein [Chondromyces crocatus]|uniref:Antibiotic transporter n=1 Tax=Chondromyces crocatus TaxID=52 RepID=A0A0K1EKU9_CHOCO|nr:aminoglycoside phosphotransferase family protein [Chondromyces crocatus]AKT41499.1 antibiotic transporter [Chondromyces crocatus]